MTLDWPDWFRKVLRDASHHESTMFETALSADDQQKIIHAIESRKGKTDDHTILVRYFEELVEATPYKRE